MCWLALFILTACGGGGSGGPGLSQPTPPGGTTPGSITQGNAKDAAIVGVAMLEMPIQLTLTGINPLIDVLDKGRLQQTTWCRSGGNIDVSTVDNDRSATISSGDVVTVAYSGGCFSEPLNDAPVEGEIQLTIGDLTLMQPGSLALRAHLSFPGDLTVSEIAPAVVSGGFEIGAAVSGVTLELLTIDVAVPDQLSISTGSGSSQITETVSELSLRRRVLAPEFRERSVSIAATSRIQSDLIDGVIRCRTNGDLEVSEPFEWPTSGALDCVGASGSTVRLDSTGRSEGSSPVSLLVDPEGDGTFTEVSGGPFSWTEFSEGELFAEQVSTVTIPAVPSLLESQVVAISLNGLVYAPNRNRLFGTTDTSVFEIDPAAMAITRSVDVPGKPGALALSEDETTLWIGLDDSNELQRIDLVTMTAGPALPLGNSVPSGVPRTVFRIRVAPGTADLVVLTTTSNEMLAYSDGVQLPDALDDTTLATLPPLLFVFRNATDIAAITASTPSTTYRVTLDPLTGLTVERTLHGFGDASAERLRMGVADIYSSRGVVFNEISESLEGMLGRPDICCYDDLAVDPQSGEIYTVGTGIDRSSSILDLYIENNRVRIGEYSIPGDSSGDRPERALLTDDYLFFTRGDSLERYERIDIVANLPGEPCTRADLGGLLVEGTYIMLDCALRDVIFDPGRNLLYAGLDDRTSRGNSIAVIDADSLEVLNYIPLGATPGDLSLSPDNSTLFADTVNTSKFAEIDLDAQVVRRNVILGFDSTMVYRARALAATAGTDGDVVIAINQDVALFNDGSPVGNVAHSPHPLNNYLQIFVSEDGASAFGNWGFGDLDVFNVSSSGVTFLQEAADAVFAFDPPDQEGRYIDSPDSRRFDTITHSVDAVCPTSPFGDFGVRVGHDPSSDLVYFGTAGSGKYRFISCDPGSDVIGELTVAPDFKSDKSLIQAILPVSNNRIAIQTDTHLVLLDRSF
jgi:hypothetical protein